MPARIQLSFVDSEFKSRGGLLPETKGDLALSRSEMARSPSDAHTFLYWKEFSGGWGRTLTFSKVVQDLGLLCPPEKSPVKCMGLQRPVTNVRAIQKCMGTPMRVMHSKDVDRNLHNHVWVCNIRRKMYEPYRNVWGLLQGYDF